MPFANYFICSMEVLDFDNLSNLKYKPTKNIRKKIPLKLRTSSLTDNILLLVSIAHFSTNFVNAENVPYCFSKLPVMVLVRMELNFFS